MNKKLLVLAFVCSLYADDMLKYSCVRPIVQNKFVESRDTARYNSEVQSFKICMEEFVLKNKEIIKARSDAITEAIDDWNDFVSGANKKPKEDREFTGSTGVPQGGSHTVDHSDPSKVSTSWKF